MPKFLNRTFSLLVLLFFITSLSFSQNNSRHCIKGDHLQDKEQYPASIRQYSKAIKNEPNNPEYYSLRAISYRRIGKYTEALADIDKCLEIDNNNKRGHYEKGAMYGIKNNNSQALHEFTLAIGIDSSYAKAYAGRGAVYHLLEQYDKALIDYQTALKLDSTQGFIFYNVGLSLNELEKYSEAIPYFNKALLLDEIKDVEASQQAYYERGRSLYNLNEYDLAEINFQNAVVFNDKLDPWEKLDNGRSYYYKGLSNVHLSKMKEACSDFENAISNQYFDAEAEYIKCNCSQLLTESNEKNEFKPMEDTSQALSIIIYPNPIRSYAIISVSKNKNLQNINLKIINVEGKIVQSFNNIGYSFVFNSKDIAAGTYLFEISNKDEIISRQKIIIQ